MSLTIGQPIPDFLLQTDGGGTLSKRDLVGQKAILYFYPKDDTSGCTKEAIGFRDALDDFGAAGTVIVGVSKDSVASHAKFKTKHDLNFPLIADIDGTLCEAFGVWVAKSMYGKSYMGVDRSTFLIDREGVIRREWRKVKVPGHVQTVLDAARTL